MAGASVDLGQLILGAITAITAIIVAWVTYRKPEKREATGDQMVLAATIADKATMLALIAALGALEQAVAKMTGCAERIHEHLDREETIRLAASRIREERR
jgi:hypothetical protein